MNEEMRKEFEEWFISTGHNRSALNRNEFYVEVMVEEMWLAWKASREAMKLTELRSKYANQHDNESKYLSSDADIYKNALMKYYKDEE